MKTRLKNRKYLRQYVLGTHDPEHQHELEERLLTDQKLLAELSMVEHEVLFDYVSGALTQPERTKFESGYLATPEGRRDLQFFRALQTHAESFSPDPAVFKRSWKSLLPAFLRGEHFGLRVLVATAALVIVFFGLFAFYQNLNSRRVNVFSVTLGPGTTRVIGGVEMSVVDVPADASEVRLQLPIGEQNAESYTASLFTDRGEEKVRQDNLRATEKVIDLRVPASVLTSGDYRVKVKAHVAGGAVEDVASYSFRVVRH